MSKIRYGRSRIKPTYSRERVVKVSKGGTRK